MDSHPDARANEPVIDIQAIPPYQRHPLIFQAVQELKPGASFLLLNDHDPRPLHMQLMSLYGGSFTWESLESGPEVWCVRIAKIASAADTASDGAARRDGSCCGGMCG